MVEARIQLPQTTARGALLMLSGFLGRRERAFVAQQGVFDFQHELLPLVPFAFVDALEFKSQLAHGFVGGVKFAFQTGDVALQLPHVALKKERLPYEFKELLEHGG